MWYFFQENPTEHLATSYLTVIRQLNNKHRLSSYLNVGRVAASGPMSRRRICDIRRSDDIEKSPSHDVHLATVSTSAVP